MLMASAFFESGKTYQTKKGSEKVRSKGEQKIANFLFEQKIEYIYEPLLMIGNKKVRPDFYLYEYGIFIEYFGMQGDKVYDQKTEKKIAFYQKLGIKVIKLFPDEINHFGAFIRTDFYNYTNKQFPQVEYFDWRKLKSCPFCTKEIRSDALSCQYCHRVLNSESSKLHPGKEEVEGQSIGILAFCFGLAFILFAQLTSNTGSYIAAYMEFALAILIFSKLQSNIVNSNRFRRNL